MAKKGGKSGNAIKYREPFLQPTQKKILLLQKSWSQFSLQLCFTRSIDPSQYLRFYMHNITLFISPHTPFRLICCVDSWGFLTYKKSRQTLLNSSGLNSDLSRRSVLITTFSQSLSSPLINVWSGSFCQQTINLFLCSLSMPQRQPQNTCSVQIL